MESENLLTDELNMTRPRTYRRGPVPPLPASTSNDERSQCAGRRP